MLESITITSHKTYNRDVQKLRLRVVYGYDDMNCNECEAIV
ncbi:MAG TPA: hypothetical protein VGQ53_06735 [Chitinophagaceae bacterium]|nr:hypothetical protein [Chitinophagaceae bacterium]